MPEWQVPGYTGLRALGSGGFGDVVLARHEESGTLVAVKYLHGELLADPGFAAMFRGEAAVLASLDDPNVVRLYEYVESPAGAAIVMELIDGVSVREILSRQGATSAEAALVVLQGSLLGLAAAHARGVVHRDYKPENVLVNGDGASKLTDFGIAARAGDRPVPAGTLVYAPPEQFGGSPASPAGDVYAATATFYECLTGHPPFTGDSAERLLYQHLSEPVPLDPVPEPLRPLVTAGMAKNPADRPADAATFVTQLRTVAADAYGQDWEDRGRSSLGEAALLLAALWPSGAQPAVQGTAVRQVRLPRSSQGSRQSRHRWHLRHLRHEAHLRHLRRLRLAMAATAAAAVATVAVVAVVVVTSRSSHSPSGTGAGSSPSAASTSSRTRTPPPVLPEFYVHNGYELGSLYKYPNFPARIALNNGAYLSGIQWTQAGPGSATATGTLNVNNCIPSCAGGTYVQYSVRLLASDPRQCNVAVYAPYSDVSQEVRAYVFNQIQVAAVSGNPPSVYVGTSPPDLPAACG